MCGMLRNGSFGVHPLFQRLKRGIKGTYVSVEPFHLQAYVDEQAFRFNERKGKDKDRFLGVLAGIDGKRVMYKTLIGNDTGH